MDRFIEFGDSLPIEGLTDLKSNMDRFIAEQTANGVTISVFKIQYG